MKYYIARVPLEHDGKHYPAGGVLELDASAAIPYLAVDAIVVSGDGTKRPRGRPRRVLETMPARAPVTTDIARRGGR